MSKGKPAYKRIILKISGEALAGEQKTGLDFKVMKSVCEAIKKCVELGVETGIVVGGGNFWRGVKDGEGKIERTRADHMGMMATVMNCLALADMLEQMDVPVRVQTAIPIQAVAAANIRWDISVSAYKNITNIKSPALLISRFLSIAPVAFAVSSNVGGSFIMIFCFISFISS